MTRDQHVRSAVAAASSAAHEAVRGSDLEDVVLCAAAAGHHARAALRCPECRDGVAWSVHVIPIAKGVQGASGVACRVCDGSGWRSP